MRTELMDTSKEPASHTLTEVLVETILSHVQILRLMAPDRYRELLIDLPSAPSVSSPLSAEEYTLAWDDLEDWITKFREQDRMKVESE
jgi:hypothetical protein